MADVVIPTGQQIPGKQLGGVWVVIQAWPVASLWTMALLGENGARITAGGPEYDVLHRTRRVGMTTFKGRRNWEMTIDLIYDGWITHLLRPDLPAAWTGVPRLPVGVRWSRPGTPSSSGGWHIEGMLKSLYNLMYRRDDTGVPPSVRVFGGVPYQAGDRWLISDVTWGESLWDVNTGRRMRQEVEVKLLEYAPGEELQRLPRGKANAQAAKGG